MRLHAPISPSLHSHACLNLATQTSSSSFLALGAVTAGCDTEDIIKSLEFFKAKVLSFKAEISQSLKRSHRSRGGAPKSLYKSTPESPQYSRQCLIDHLLHPCSELVWARIEESHKMGIDVALVRN